MSKTAEDGRKVEAGMTPERVRIQPSALPVPSSVDGLAAAHRERLQDLFDRALKGDLPLERELLDGELKRLQPIHIQLIIARSTSRTIKEAAEAVGMSADQAAVALAHPHAQLLLVTILSMAADKVLDVQTRLKWLANEALSVKVDLMRLSKNDKIRGREAGDILALAGFGQRVGIQINNSTTNRATLQLPEKIAAQLMKAFTESQTPIDYQKHLVVASGDEIGAEHRQLSNSLATGTGHTSSQSGASPAPSPFAPLQQPVDAEFTVETWEDVKTDAEEVAAALEDEKESKVA